MAETWQFTYSSTLTEPPSGSQVRFDGATPYDTVTKVWVRLETTDGNDVYFSLMHQPVGSTLYFQDKNDHTRHVAFTLTAAPVDRTTYVEYAVTLYAAATELINGQAILTTALAPGVEPPIPPSPSPFMRAPWQSPLSTYAVCVTPPTWEPLTLEEGKLRAALDWVAGDPRDQLMTDFIRTARAKVERDTGLALPMQTWDVTIALLPPDGLVPLPSQTQPTQSIESIVASRTPRGRQLLDPRSYVLARGAVAFSDWTADWGPYDMRVVSGWPTAEALKAEAPLLVQAVGLLTAHYATLGRDLASTAESFEVPLGYEECISPYRLMWLT